MNKAKGKRYVSAEDLEYRILRMVFVCGLIWGAGFAFVGTIFFMVGFSGQ